MEFMTRKIDDFDHRGDESIMIGTSDSLMRLSRRAFKVAL